MIDIVLKPYLRSIIFQILDCNRIQNELKDLMESNFKFEIKIGELKMIDESGLMGDVYFKDVDDTYKTIDFHLAHKQVEIA